MDRYCKSKSRLFRSENINTLVFDKLSYALYFQIAKVVQHPITGSNTLVCVSGTTGVLTAYDIIFWIYST